MRLDIAKADSTDVYKDLARIPEKYRIDHKGEPIPEGRICKVTVSGESVLLSLRGQQSHPNASIYLDEKTRLRLGLETKDNEDFCFRQVSWFGQFLWVWRASDPAYRIAARVGLLSILIGVAGLLLSIKSICPAWVCKL